MSRSWSSVAANLVSNGTSSKIRLLKGAWSKLQLPKPSAVASSSVSHKVTWWKDCVSRKSKNFKSLWMSTSMTLGSAISNNCHPSIVAWKEHTRLKRRKLRFVCQGMKKSWHHSLAKRRQASCLSNSRQLRWPLADFPQLMTEMVAGKK